MQRHFQVSAVVANNSAKIGEHGEPCGILWFGLPSIGPQNPSKDIATLRLVTKERAHCCIGSGRPRRFSWCARPL